MMIKKERGFKLFRNDLNFALGDLVLYKKKKCEVVGILEITIYDVEEMTNAECIAINCKNYMSEKKNIKDYETQNNIYYCETKDDFFLWVCPFEIQLIKRFPSNRGRMGVDFEVKIDENSKFFFNSLITIEYQEIYDYIFARIIYQNTEKLKKEKNLAEYLDKYNIKIKNYPYYSRDRDILFLRGKNTSLDLHPFVLTKMQFEKVKNSLIELEKNFKDIELEKLELKINNKKIQFSKMSFEDIEEFEDWLKRKIRKYKE